MGSCTVGGAVSDYDYDYSDGSDCKQKCTQDESCNAYVIGTYRAYCKIYTTAVDGGDDDPNYICHVKQTGASAGWLL